MDALSAMVGSPPSTHEYSASGALWQASAAIAPGQDSLVASVYETLWKQIVEGDRLPGERMVVSELARELDVSRTPVQNALYQLQQAGMVHAAAGRGFHVAIFSAADIRDLYNLRTILEVAAVQAAAPHMLRRSYRPPWTRSLRCASCRQPRAAHIFCAPTWFSTTS